MTTKLPDDDDSKLYTVPHAAILLTAEQPLSREAGIAAMQAVTACLEAADDTGDMRPMWIKFESIDTVHIYHLLAVRVPASRSFLGELVKAVPSIDRFNLVASFDYRARQYPKPRKRVSVSGKMPVKQAPRSVEDYVSEWPLKLRFLATDEARREARELGSIYERWPFFNFSDEDLRETSDRLMRDFGERYPLLAEADRIMGGKITKVIAELGRHPHAPVWERKRFWATLKNCAVMSWEAFADDLLAEIAAGRTDRFRFHEERLGTAAERHLHRDVARKGKPVVTVNEPRCPPSVSQALWLRVPEKRRQEAIEFAARGLRRGIHPEDALEDFLSSIASR
ncbi:hypothetical protein [Shinella sp.]|uniref:hypothetical protein n=1 Tax=Shinella sp. TaxID=1870904 RepID=UPI002583FDCC|nr:hypothetical protein [Shinella sp.]MCW5710612.1 hypothetical protein [Shinella sp.]